MTQSHETRLVLVEGLPGSGKTTLASKIADDLKSQGHQVALYLEGDMQPCDLQWISRMAPADYEAAVAHLHRKWQESPQGESWQDISSRLQTHSTAEDGHILTAYTKLDFADVELWDALDPFRNGEVHDHRVNTSQYREIYLRRWQRFGEMYRDNAQVVIFECAFLQSHVTELLAFHEAGADEIVSFLAELIEPVRHLQPELHYIQALDYSRRIREAAATRGDWLQQLIAYVSESPYGTSHNLGGFDGAMKFFDERMRIERIAMQQLPLTTHIITR